MNKTLGEYISYLRNSRNYALREFAEIIEISPFYLSSIENGRKSNPSIEILGKIYTALELSKTEMETLLDLHAKANGQASFDIVEYIMKNDDVRSGIRSDRDRSSDQYWNEFIKRITNK